MLRRVTLQAVSIVALVSAGGCLGTGGRCENQADCTGGSICHDGTCARLCGASTDCPRGFVCDEIGVCLTVAPACVVDADCTSPGPCETATGASCTSTGCVYRILSVDCDTACVPACAGRVCGDDGCGGACGTCSAGVCIDGVCTAGDCSADCAGAQYSACSCGAADPCGWQGDGACDASCATAFPTDYFDDSVDCTSGPCTGECASAAYSACTCGSTDPCGWRGDGTCDDQCAIAFPNDSFDDSPDCGVATDCSTDCTNLTYSACSCSAADPCGWRADGTCDDQCAVAFPGDSFDDAADCPVDADCSANCTNFVYSTCSCSSGDPCGWQGDGVCDAQCATAFPGNHFDDAVDCP